MSQMALNKIFMRIKVKNSFQPSDTVQDLFLTEMPGISAFLPWWFKKQLKDL